MKSEQKEIALRFQRLAFANHTDRAIEMLHPEATYWVLGDPARLRVAGSRTGTEIGRLLRGAARAIPGGMQIEIHGITAEQDRVAIEVESNGIWQDGRSYHNHYHFLIVVRLQRIFSVREYMDTLQVHDMVTT